jgi:hypothetical protein
MGKHSYTHTHSYTHIPTVLPSPYPSCPSARFSTPYCRLTLLVPSLTPPPPLHPPPPRLATKPVVSAVRSYAVSQQPTCKLLFGLDANTYAKPDPDQQGVTDFASFYTSLALNSCYGPHPNPLNFTTFHARTHLQPQLNKAVTLEEKDIKGDKNPKDFVLFFDADFKVLSTNKDNTGKKVYIEGMVFPTLTFPSDHGITSTVLLETTK